MSVPALFRALLNYFDSTDKGGNRDVHAVAEDALKTAVETAAWREFVEGTALFLRQNARSHGSTGTIPTG